MSKFWQKKYISKYTGEEIDAAVAKAGDATKVVANPTLAGTEAALEGLQVGNTKYKVGGSGGIHVILTSNKVAVDGGYTLGISYNDVKNAFYNGEIYYIVDNSGLFLQDTSPDFNFIYNIISFGYVPEDTSNNTPETWGIGIKRMNVLEENFGMTSTVSADDLLIFAGR